MTINAIQNNIQFLKIIQRQVNNQQQVGESKVTGRDAISQPAQNTSLQVAHAIKDVVAVKADTAKQEVFKAEAAVAEKKFNLASAIALSFAYIEKQNADANLDIAEAQAANMEKNAATS